MKINKLGNHSFNESYRFLELSPLQKKKTSEFNEPGSIKIKSNFLTSMIFLVVVPEETGSTGNNFIGYIIGTVIAMILVGWLIDSLLKPDKF